MVGYPFSIVNYIGFHSVWNDGWQIWLWRNAGDITVSR